MSKALRLSAAQDHAQAQVTNRQQAALAAAGENWSPIEAARAEPGRRAADQATAWAALLAQAQAGEPAMAPTT